MVSVHAVAHENTIKLSSILYDYSGFPLLLLLLLLRLLLARRHRRLALARRLLLQLAQPLLVELQLRQTQRVAPQLGDTR